MHAPKPDTDVREYSYSVNRSDIHILVLRTTFLLWCEVFFLLFPPPVSLSNFSRSFFGSDWVTVNCVFVSVLSVQRRGVRGGTFLAANSREV